jgi:hypothetical protein
LTKAALLQKKNDVLIEAIKAIGRYISTSGPKSVEPKYRSPEEAAVLLLEETNSSHVSRTIRLAISVVISSMRPRQGLGDLIYAAATLEPPSWNFRRSQEVLQIGNVDYGNLLEARARQIVTDPSSIPHEDFDALFRNVSGWEGDDCAGMRLCPQHVRRMLDLHAPYGRWVESASFALVFAVLFFVTAATTKGWVAGAMSIGVLVCLTVVAASAVGLISERLQAGYDDRTIVAAKAIAKVPTALALVIAASTAILTGSAGPVFLIMAIPLSLLVFYFGVLSEYFCNLSDAGWRKLS